MEHRNVDHIQLIQGLRRNLEEQHPLAPARPAEAPAVPAPYVPRDADRVTVGKTLSMRNDWYTAALGLLGKPESRDGEAGALAAQLVAERKVGPAGGKDQAQPIIAEEDLEQQFPKRLPKLLAKRLARARHEKPEETAHALKEKYIRTINHKHWAPIRRDIAPGTDAEVTSTLTPVNVHYSRTYDRQHGLPGKQYGDCGLSSMTPRLDPQGRDPRETFRPTNLWHTALDAPDGERLFSGFRSGAFTDVGFGKDQYQRRNAGSAKAHGVLEAMVIQKLEAMDDQTRARYAGGEVLDGGPIVGLDLMSNSKLKGDASMVADHHAVIARTNNVPQLYNVKVGDTTMQVQAAFDFLDFNTGVNFAAAKGGAKSDAQREWNEPRFERLMKYVARHKESSRDDPAKLRQLDLLMAAIADAGLGKAGSYELPAMLANVGSMIGANVHFNCKSGKDRTGIADAEAKHLARELRRARDAGDEALPALTAAERDPAAEARHQQMIWETGNLEVLAKNVGGQCLKTADLAWIPKASDARLRDNLGGKEMLKELEGLKRYANIDKIVKL